MTILKKIKYNAPCTLTFALLCLVATFLGVISNGKLTFSLFETYRAPLTNPMMYVRLFTHVLGHAGWTHFFNNIIYILLLGPILEEKYGSANLLEMICITAVITGIVNNIFFSSGLCGASGIAFMMIILVSAVNFSDGNIPITFLLIIIYYIGGELYSAFAVNDNVSQLTHIIGGICGALFGFVYANMKSSGKKR